MLITFNRCYCHREQGFTSMPDGLEGLIAPSFNYGSFFFVCWIQKHLGTINTTTLKTHKWDVQDVMTKIIFNPSDKTHIAPDSRVLFGIDPSTLLMGWWPREKLEKLTAPEPPRTSGLVYLWSRPLLLLLCIRAECCPDLWPPASRTNAPKMKRRHRCCRTTEALVSLISQRNPESCLSAEKEGFSKAEHPVAMRPEQDQQPLEKKTLNTKEGKEQKQFLPGLNICSTRGCCQATKLHHYITFPESWQMGHKIKVCCGKIQMRFKTL